MRNNVCKKTLTKNGSLAQRGWCISAAVIALTSATGLAMAEEHGPGRYHQTNLVSDQPGVAMIQDTNLVNAWGVSSSPTSPFWVSDNGTGLATLYSVTNDSMGMVHVDKQGLEVSIPGEGNPTGQLFDGTGSFRSNIFIFASEDGTISGWRGSLGTAAEVLVPASSAIYKGIALVTTSNGPTLLAANFANNTLDAYDTNLTLVGQFSDPRAPTDYAPFNVQVVAGAVFVTFAKQDADKHDDVSGPGNGLIDIFNPRTLRFRRFATGSDAGGRLRVINSPWGLALAPKRFGSHEDQLLVGNFGSGTIMAFEADGEFEGLLRDESNKTLVIDGLWALKVGNGGRGGLTGTVYFSAGPDDESHGLFGSLDPVRNRNDRGRGNDDRDGDGDKGGDHGGHGGHD